MIRVIAAIFVVYGIAVCAYFFHHRTRVTRKEHELRDAHIDSEVLDVEEELAETHKRNEARRRALGLETY